MAARRLTRVPSGLGLGLCLGLGGGRSSGLGLGYVVGYARGLGVVGLGFRRRRALENSHRISLGFGLTSNLGSGNVVPMNNSNGNHIGADWRCPTCHDYAAWCPDTRDAYRAANPGWDSPTTDDDN